jgi:RHS repeat-associated protein
VLVSVPSAFTVTVAYATSNGTATAASDYTAKSGTLTFAPGQTSQSLSLAMLNDTAQESSETINLTLSSPANATVGAPNPATMTILDDETPPIPNEEFYTYDQIGNMLSKTSVGNYTYGASGAGTGAGPHQARTIGSTTYSYDLNGNLTGGAGSSYMWDAENRPLTISRTSGSESYAYDADGERVKVVAGSITTVYLGGMWEETGAGATKAYYSFGGQTVAVRDSVQGLSFLHSDHLGSVSVVSGAGASLLSSQRFDPWGKVLPGGTVTQTRKNYTGQYLDTTGLLYYHARYYDPSLARFVSADSVVPGSASGAGGGAATLGVSTASQLAPLTIDFHEPGLAATLNYENAFRQSNGFWFQLSDDDKRQAKSPWGPLNPQALNRYSYVLNNPLRYVDPTGHYISGGNREAGYATVCADSAGNYARCGSDTKEVRNADGTASLMRVWAKKCGGGACITYTKYVWSNKASFADFKSYVDAIDDAIRNVNMALAGAIAATIAAVAACATAVGCPVGVAGYLVATGILFYWLDRRDNLIASAKEHFWRIDDVEPHPPAGSPKPAVSTAVFDDPGSW